jgi:hypothetical protein
MRLALRVVTGLVVSVMVLSLLGGWAVPATLEGRVAIATGGAIHLAKVSLLTAAILVVRGSHQAPESIVWRRIVPASAVCAAGSIALAAMRAPRASRYFVAASVVFVVFVLGIVLRAFRPRPKGVGPRWIPSAIH